MPPPPVTRRSLVPPPPCVCVWGQSGFHNCRTKPFFRPSNKAVLHACRSSCSWSCRFVPHSLTTQFNSGNLVTSRLSRTLGSPCAIWSSQSSLPSGARTLGTSNVISLGGRSAFFTDSTPDGGTALLLLRRVGITRIVIVVAKELSFMIFPALVWPPARCRASSF